MAKHDKHETAASIADTAPEVLLPVKGLPVLFTGGLLTDAPAEIKSVDDDGVKVEVTKPSGTKFVQTLPATPGKPSAKGYSWRHV